LVLPSKHPEIIEFLRLSKVSLQDGQVGDTVGGTDLSSVGSGKSTFAIDADG
jgi:hypothetical protein